LKHIASYSDGIGNYFTAKRVLKLYGNKDIILLYTHTLIEDDDLYRFIDEMSVRFGYEIVKIADGRTP